MDDQMGRKSKVAIGCTLLLIVCTWSCSALLRPHRLREAVRTNDFDTFARLVDESDANSPYRSTVSYTLYLLHGACSDSDERIVRLLLRKGADIHKKDSSGKSCIFHAVGRDDIRAAISILRVLHEHDSTVVDDRETYHGDTVLHYAARIEAHKEVVEELIRLEADLQAKNNNGETPRDVYRQETRFNPPILFENTPGAP
ncbi:hypothetical protein GYB59_09385 [bacterium]|nr:hypothetical protein [bacterium]